MNLSSVKGQIVDARLLVQAVAFCVDHDGQLLGYAGGVAEAAQLHSRRLVNCTNHTA